ncbi:MAG: aminotransferase class IV [Bacteroidales bacterium]|nr:aminotransferase class IV [Bacteroidales bacterium]
MCRFIETIRVENRNFQNIQYHQARMDYTREKMMGLTRKLSILQQIEIPDTVGNEIHKCRVVYGEHIDSVEFALYLPRQIKTLRLIADQKIDYAYKYADRCAINRIFEMRGNCDDILIVKDHLVTDTSYCNIILYKGKSWITPETPLLKGTKRQQLLDEGKITAGKIKANNLKDFEKFMLINAMLDFDEARSQAVGGIRGLNA